MIDSRFVVSDDHRVALLIFGEFPDERFTLFRIEAGSWFVGFQGLLVSGEFPEQRLTLFRIERDLLLRGRFTELGGSLVGGELAEQGDALDEILKKIVTLFRVEMGDCRRRFVRG